MPHITTFSGKKFDPSAITMESIDIADIAHALARIVRFNGHQEAGYTVGMHSICCALRMAEKGDIQFAKEALLHDATEAYLCDIPTPIKSMLPEYKALEHDVDQAIRQAFELPVQMSDAVKQIDQMMLIAEAFVLHPLLWDELGQPVADTGCVQLVQAHVHYGHRNTQSLFVELESRL